MNEKQLKKQQQALIDSLKKQITAAQLFYPDQKDITISLPKMESLTDERLSVLIYPILGYMPEILLWQETQHTQKTLAGAVTVDIVLVVLRLK